MMFDLAAIYFGVFLGVFPLTMMKIIRQTRKIIAQSRTYHNLYLYMIWIEALVNFIFAVVTYLYLTHIIPGSLSFYIGTVVLWATQTQLLSQIIANRVALIMVNKRKALWMKLVLLAITGAVNFAVCVIWTSAYKYGSTPEQKHINVIFEKTEKAFFLVVDLGLNWIFLYFVRYRLISHGLSKYWQLFNFNIALVVLSTGLDAALLGMLSMENPYLYVQFAPVVYIIKLHIELTMAALIAKIVKKTVTNTRGLYAHQPGRNPGKAYAQVSEPSERGENRSSTGTQSATTLGHDVEIQKGEYVADMPLNGYSGKIAIMKTVTTTISSAGHARDHQMDV